MKLPFTTQQFMEVFKTYNVTVWPMQLVFLLLALITVYIVTWKPTVSGRIVPVILGLLWIWMGGVYHMLFFSKINEAANIFGLLFIVEGIVFLRYGITARGFGFRRGRYGIAAAVLLIYALIIYPVIGYYAGHAYPYSPTFGLPCPTTIFTFGILVLSKQRLPFYVLIIPFIWALIGVSAAAQLGVYEDTGLLISAIVMGVLNLMKHRESNDVHHYKFGKIVKA